MLNNILDPNFLGKMIAHAVGTAIGSIESEISARKQQEAQYQQNKNRQDYEIKTLRLEYENRRKINDASKQK